MSQLLRASGASPFRGYTLIELMIVVAIIAVIVSLALPAYHDYTVRTKVAEGLSIAASAKIAVAETCMSDPTVVPNNTRSGFGFSSSKYVESIIISNSCAEPWIVIRTENTGAAIDVVLSLDGYFSSQSGRVVWNCHQVTGRLNHLPSTCRGNHGWP